MFVYAIVFRQTSLKILSPSSNENCFCAQSVFCPFDSWLTYFATTVIIEYWNIFQCPLLQRPNVFTRFFLYGMCQNEDYPRQSLDHTLLQSTALHCTKLHFKNIKFQTVELHKTTLNCTMALFTIQGHFIFAFHNTMINALILWHSLASRIDPRYPLSNGKK